MSVLKPSYEEIMEKVSSKDESERRYAAHLLGEMKKRESIKPLMQLLFDISTAVQEAAADALVKIGGEEVVREIIPLLRSEDVALRNLAIEILEEIGEKAIDTLPCFLKDKDHDMRKFICDILGNIGSPKAIPYLIPVLNDPHINVACAACEALGNIKDKKATEALVKILKDKERKYLVYNAVEALGKIKDTRAVEPLMGLSPSKDSLLLFALIRAFGEIGDVRVVDYLLSELNSPALGKVAVEALAKIARKNKEKISSCLKNYPDKVKLLRKFLKDSSSEVRKDATFLLGVVKDKEAMPFLTSLLSDEEEKVKEEAMRALLEVDPELTFLSQEVEDVAREILEVFLYDNDKRLRELAGKALKKFSFIPQK